LPLGVLGSWGLRAVFLWVFSRSYQHTLDDFREWHNNKYISAHCPAQAFEFPESYGGQQLHTRVPKAAIDIVRANLPPRQTWLAAEVEKALEDGWIELGSPHLTLATAWDVYRALITQMQGAGES
jgi:hypothetical protein